MKNKEIIDKDEYIKYLENKIFDYEKNSNIEETENFKAIYKSQEEFLFQNYAEKDYYLGEIKRLNNDIGNVLRMISLDKAYIDYLSNSYWWKMTLPFRKLYKKIKSKNESINFLESLDEIKKSDSLDVNVSVVIFTSNPDAQFKLQLKNLVEQKKINKVNIVVIDRGSDDNTLDYAKEYNAKIVKAGNSLSNVQMFEKILSSIDGEYVVMLEQDKIINSKYWIYQSIKPIYDNKATATVFFKENVDFLKNSLYYNDLKKRIKNIDDNVVLFLPENRDIVFEISPDILDKSSIVVKKRNSNYFLI